MSDAEFYSGGFYEFEELLEEYSKKVDNVVEVLEIGAKEFVNDARKLPRPRSMINRPGYTHLIDTIWYQRNNGEVEVVWEKYYGPMVEKGTRKMKAQPHLRPLFEKNKEKYYKKMIERIGG